MSASPKYPQVVTSQAFRGPTARLGPMALYWRMVAFAGSLTMAAPCVYGIGSLLQQAGKDTPDNAFIDLFGVFLLLLILSAFLAMAYRAWPRE